MSIFTKEWLRMSGIVNGIAVEHGFWLRGVDEDGMIPTKLCLIHSEVSEAMEADRTGNVDNFGEELADIVIRTMDLAYQLEYDLGEIIEDKIKRNDARPHKHGKRY